MWAIPITLNDGAGHSRTYTLIVSVIQSLPPVYTNAPITYDPVTVALNFTKDVPIPLNYDPEGGAVIVICEDMTTGAPINCIVASDYSFITFAPLSFDEIGVHIVNIIL